MRSCAVLLAALLLPACATLGLGGGSPGAERTRLWEQAHDAFSRDSFRVAEAMFQRLAVEFPRTHEGHEARFYLGVLNLEPRSRLDLKAAEEHLGLYLADDSTRRLAGYHGREAETLLAFARVLQRPCETRPGSPGCDPAAAPSPATPDSTPPAPNAAEVARLRRQLAERDATIRELRNELQRIRNTLTPRNPRED